MKQSDYGILVCWCSCQENVRAQHQFHHQCPLQECILTEKLDEMSARFQNCPQTYLTSDFAFYFYAVHVQHQLKKMTNKAKRKKKKKETRNE
jgi:hypothetical protein